MPLLKNHVGNKGIFDYSNTLDKSKLDAAKYGIQDPQSGTYSDLSDVTQAHGFDAQLDALGMYRAGALGQGDSVAQRMLNQQTSANARGGLQMAAMGRGGNLAGMQSQAMAQTAGGQAQAAQQGALLRAQEMQANRAAYAGMASQMYGQGFGYDQLAAQTGLGYNQQMIDWNLGTRQQDMNESNASWNKALGLFNAGAGVVGAGADMLGMGGEGKSDERQKVGIKPTNPYGQASDPYQPDADVPFGERVTELRRNKSANGGFNIPAKHRPNTVDPFAEAPQYASKSGTIDPDVSATATLDAIQPSSFEYAPGAGPPGRRVGVMAQDLEKTPAGKAVVRDTPQGKMVDTFGASTLALAGLAEARQREKNLEARLAAVEGQRQNEAQPAGLFPNMAPDVTMTPSLTPAQIAEKRKRPGGGPPPQTLLHKPGVGKPVPLGRGGQGGVMSGKPSVVELTPEQQQLEDDFYDELSKWTYVDEMGHRKVGSKRMEMGAMPLGVKRFVDAQGEDEVLQKPSKRLKSKSEGMI